MGSLIAARVFISHAIVLPSSPKVSITFLSVLKYTPVTAPECSFGIMLGPLSPSNFAKLIPKRLAYARVFPSGLKAAEETSPSSDATASPRGHVLAISQRTIALSSLLVARIFPFGLMP